MPSGGLGDLAGRKRFFVVGMVVFTVLAFAGAFAPSAPVLIVLRLLNESRNLGLVPLDRARAAVSQLVNIP